MKSLAKHKIPIISKTVLMCCDIQKGCKAISVIPHVNLNWMVSTYEYVPFLPCTVKPDTGPWPADLLEMCYICSY